MSNKNAKPATSKNAAPKRNKVAEAVNEAVSGVLPEMDDAAVTAYVETARVELADNIAAHNARREELVEQNAGGIHDKAIKAEENGAKYADKWLNLLADSRCAKAYAQLALTPKACASIQIYAQDKVMGIVKALACNASLSTVMRNATTQTLIAAIMRDGLRGTAENEMTVSAAPAAMHDINPNIGMSTYNAQAITSRLALALCGMLDFDGVRKAFRLNDRGLHYAELIGK